MSKTKNCFALIASVYCSYSYAELGTSPELFDLSLEDLLSTKVSVAATKSEEVIDTPAIVSRYNRADLEKMGITNLREMFNFIPGVILQESMPGFATSQTRGIDETFNQKVLFLLDGIPYHQPSHSMIPMEGIPWESISHVEVIRGPGAVFHGTQASSGVFNVVTKTQAENASLSLTVGKDNLYEGSIFFNSQLANAATLSIAAEIRDEDKYTTRYEQTFPDVGLIIDDVDRHLKKKSVLLRYQHEELSILAHAFNDTTIGLNDGYTDTNTLQPFVVDSEAQLFHIKNNWVVDKAKFSLFGDYNIYTFTLNINNLFAPNVGAIAAKDGNGSDDYRLRFGATFTYDFHKNLQFSSGLEQETRSAGAYRFYADSDPTTPLVTLFEKNSVKELSAYSQLDYILDNWRFLVGARYTNNENNGAKITPRVAVLYKLDKHQSLKALYSTGFNSPNPTQTSVNLPGNVIGNNKLSAEVVEAYDFAYSYSKDNTLIVANIYRLKANDFIVRKFVPELDSVSFFNEGNYTRTGAELDSQIASKKGKLFANLAYQKEGNRRVVDDLDAFRVPRLTATLGADYNFSVNDSIGASVAYIGSRTNIDSYTVVNLNYTKKFEHFDLYLNVKNALNDEIITPDNTSQESTLVGRTKRNPQVTLSTRIYF
jgi:outer membrane receptor for ferrienterochelin and colicins